METEERLFPTRLDLICFQHSRSQRYWDQTRTRCSPVIKAGLNVRSVCVCVCVCMYRRVHHVREPHTSRLNWRQTRVTSGSKSQSFKKVETMNIQSGQMHSLVFPSLNIHRPRHTALLSRTLTVHQCQMTDYHHEIMKF